MDTTTTATGSNYGFGAQYDDAIQGAHKTLRELTALKGDMRDRGGSDDPTHDEMEDLDARVEMVSDMIDRLQEVCDFAWEALD